MLNEQTVTETTEYSEYFISLAEYHEVNSGCPTIIEFGECDLEETLELYLSAMDSEVYYA